MNKEDTELYREMENWTQTLKSNGYGHSDPPVQTILATRERFLVAVGDRLADKRQSIRLMKYMLRGSKTLREATLRYAPQIVESVQQEAKSAGSYRITEGPSRHNKGNCVVATQPFGKEGSENQGLLFRITNQEVLHARCYLAMSRKDMGKNPRLTVWVDTALVADVRNGDVRKLKGGDRYVDLTLKIAKSALYRANGKSTSSGMIVPLKLKGEWDVLGTHRKHDNVTGTSIEQNRKLVVLADTDVWFDGE